MGHTLPAWSVAARTASREHSLELDESSRVEEEGGSVPRAQQFSPRPTASLPNTRGDCASRGPGCELWGSGVRIKAEPSVDPLCYGQQSIKRVNSDHKHFAKTAGINIA